MSWKQVLTGGLKAALVAFVVLQVKEKRDAGQFDTPGTAADGALVGAGMLVVNAIQKLVTKP
jgi:hypothetical protein